MHDTLTYISRDPIHRRYHHDRLTFRMIYADLCRTHILNTHITLFYLCDALRISYSGFYAFSYKKPPSPYKQALKRRQKSNGFVLRVYVKNAVQSVGAFQR